MTAAMLASTRDSRHSRRNARGCSRPATGSTTMAASTARGTACSAGVNSSSATSTTTTLATPAQPVRAPAYRLSAERENDELVGKAPLKPDASLARPWPIRSWSWSQRAPRWALSTCALLAVSRKLTSVITSVGSRSWASTSQPGQPGHTSAGRPCGRSPITAPPAASKPVTWLIAAPATTTASTAGTFGPSRRASSKTAIVPSPKAAAGRCHAAGSSARSHDARPSNAGNCEAMISTAAAWVKAISTGAFTRLSNQPKRTSPSTTCSRPLSSASHIASCTHWALPGAASPVSDALTSRQVSAVGPTDRRGEALNNTAISAGSSEA